jgi:hypothetical protein
MLGCLLRFNNVFYPLHLFPEVSENHKWDDGWRECVHAMPLIAVVDEI